MSARNITLLLGYLLACQDEWNKWIGSMIEYKGYVGWFEFDERSSLFLGKVINIDTLVTFQGKSIKKVKQGFQAAIDDYLEWCKRHAKEPEKPSTKVKDSASNNCKIVAL